MSLKFGRKSAIGGRVPVPSPSRQPRPRQQLNTSTTKKATLQPIPAKPANPNPADSESQPISDFPSPPVQIVSCGYGQGDELAQIPQIAAAPTGEIPQLAFKKLKQCNKLCDFSDPRADARSKATKEAALSELIDCYSNQRMFARLTRECHQALIEMFATNVFRPLPNIPRAIMASDEVEIEDTAWPHLRLVYLLFRQFLECQVDQRILQFQLTPRFITNLFALLDFPDAREREQVKLVIARIFNKVPSQRPLLRIITANLLMGVPEGLQINAASYLLQLFYEFTEMAQPPLPPPLVNAFHRVLLPLHLPHRCQRYFEPLVKCVLLIIKKDASLGEALVEFLIAHWPVTLDSKSELLIDEVTQMLDEKCVKDNMPKIMTCIAMAVESPCRRLAEKALNFLLDNRMQNIILENSVELLSILFPPLFRSARGHWQQTVQLKALNTMNTFMELDPEAFRKVAEQFKENVIMDRAKKINKRNLWEAVAQVAAQKDTTVDCETIGKDLTAFYGVGKSKVRGSKQGKLHPLLAMSHASASQDKLKPEIPHLHQPFAGTRHRMSDISSSQSLLDTSTKPILSKTSSTDEQPIPLQATNPAHLFARPKSEYATSFPPITEEEHASTGLITRPMQFEAISEEAESIQCATITEETTPEHASTGPITRPMQFEAISEEAESIQCATITEEDESVRPSEEDTFPENPIEIPKC